MLQKLGTPLVMDELYSLDASILQEMAAITPVCALVFLFKWTAEREGEDVGSGTARGPKTGGVYDPSFEGFYSKQVCIVIRFQLLLIDIRS